ncbi:MAG: ABC-type transport auxiliary lipoprotein family protein [Steroidobacteraceae bacterium]
MINPRRLRPMLLLGAVWVAGGCSGLRSDSTAPVSWLLSAPPAAAVAAGDADALTAVAVRVERPVAPPGFDTDRILLIREPRVLEHYAGSRWTGPLPDVLTVLLVDTLRAANVFTAVHDSGAALQSDYSLRVAIRHFEADSTGGGAPVARVVLDATVGRRADRGIVATFTAEGRATADAERMRDVVAAFDVATTAALRELATRAVEAIATDTSSQ